MFQMSVRREFCAAHALRFRGTRESVHGHNFVLTVTLEGAELDADGVLVDFHELETLIDGIIGPWRNANLNDMPPFAGDGGVNPSAELVCRHVAERVASGIGRVSTHAKGNVRVASVSVTEAPGCLATYFPDR